MTALFLQVLDMSRVASLVILSVILVRFALKRVPKIYSYLLWGVVLFRLACPISIELPVSLIPEMESLTDSYQQVKLENSFMEEEVNGNTIGNSIVDMDVIDIYPTIDTWWQENEVVCVTQEEGVETQNEKTMNGKVAQKFFGWEVWIVFGSYIWLVGMIVMIGRSIFSYYKWKQQLLGNVCLRENIYLCDYIDSPFVMGMIKPRIYLPSFLKETEQEYIILHEQQHIKRM